MNEIKIPFSGFYESLYSDGIDREEESFIEHQLEGEDKDDENAISQGDFQDIVARCRDYEVMCESVAKAYLKEYENWLNEKLGTNIRLTWAAMTSPKYYNFETDRIFADLSDKNARLLFRAADKAVLTKVCKEHLKSRSGFMSFYDYQWENWGKVGEWDSNQLSMLLYALQDDNEDDFDMGMYYAMCDEAFCKAFDAGMDYPLFEQLTKELRLEKSGEIEPDNRKFPLGVTDPATYVAKFEQMNNLRGSST